MRTRRDLRLGGVLATTALIGVLGLAVRGLPPSATESNLPLAQTETTFLIPEHDLHVRFQRAVGLLQGQLYSEAEQALQAVLTQAPRLPEAHVNMGFAQLGLNQTTKAVQFFTAAIDLRPNQINAYYGLAVALERNGDFSGARGAMRSFVHLANPDDPHLSKARAALWEWEAVE